MTVDRATAISIRLWLTPEARGSAAGLIAEAKRIAPGGLDLLVNQDNARAIRFYGKHGFVITGGGQNSLRRAAAADGMAAVTRATPRDASRPLELQPRSRA